mmetsp:Transcript_33472/g.87848  ORF Transcript_33472/g.87848 Transcript_33472/m.87848 type:complete len:224 (-) Transcript_33472:1595-2266(-)
MSASSCTLTCSCCTVRSAVRHLVLASCIISCARPARILAVTFSCDSEILRLFRASRFFVNASRSLSASWRVSTSCCTPSSISCSSLRAFVPALRAGKIRASAESMFRVCSTTNAASSSRNACREAWVHASASSDLACWCRSTRSALIARRSDSCTSAVCVTVCRRRSRSVFSWASRLSWRSLQVAWTSASLVSFLMATFSSASLLRPIEPSCSRYAVTFATCI